MKALDGYVTRPTADKVKESLFNILMGEINEAYVLDLFAGTGSLGIEALSRGARHAVFIDNNIKAVSIIKENLIHTKLSEKGTVIKGDAFAELYKLSQKGEKFDIIFIDPPYNKGLAIEALKAIDELNVLSDEGIISVEVNSKENLPDGLGTLALTSKRKYGDTTLAFYRKR